MHKTPILILIFNRPGKTKKVLEVLQSLKPPQVYLVADGPREGNLTDITLCSETRELALKMINWPCKLVTQLRNENVGCGKGVSDAITWFFSHVEEGIILEDDCIPDLSFFDFCSVLLERYRHQERIMHIGANNFQNGNIRGDGDYYYSFFSHNWGWATWRRAWKYFEYDLDNKKNNIRKTYKSIYRRNKPLIWFLDNRFNEIKMPQNHIWDIQWHFSIIKNRGLSITPNKILVKNIGFGDDATHTKFEEDWNRLNPSTELISFKQPSSIIIDNIADRLTMTEIFKIDSSYLDYKKTKEDKSELSKKKYLKIAKKIIKTLLLRNTNQV